MLDVDHLRTFINAYFKKLIDIVQKYGGDVIKFAGDALFVVWQAPCYSLADVEALDAAARVCVQKAVLCSLEINSSCSNYKVEVGNNKKGYHTKILETVAGELPGMVPLSSPATATSKGAGGLRHNFNAVYSNSNSNSEQGTAVLSYLNVHSGLSVGIMSGLDVGMDQRWEFLLIGQPLNDVAIAEGEAEKGELVISPVAHRLLHPQAVVREEAQGGETGFAADGKEGKSCSSSCGCKVTAKGFFAVTNASVLNDETLFTEEEADRHQSIKKIVAANQHRRSSINILTKKRRTVEGGEANQQDGTGKMDSSITGGLLSMVSSIKDVQEEEAAAGEEADEEEEEDSLNIYQAFLEDVQHIYKVWQQHQQQIQQPSSSANGLDLYETFVSWVEDNLVEDLARHTHQVARADHRFVPAVEASERRLWSSYLQQQQQLLADSNAAAAAGHGGQPQAYSRRASRQSLSGAESGEAGAAAGGGGNRGSRLSLTHRGSVGQVNCGHGHGGGEGRLNHLRRKYQADIERKMKNESFLLSELRDCIVLFINVTLKNSEVSCFNTSSSPDSRQQVAGSSVALQTALERSFCFLDRSKLEQEEDQAVLQRFQSCFEVLVKEFQRDGGQMRQFIVDDKGTVGIGTFGLKGSTSNDNAAAAIDTAYRIIDGLSDIGIEASIGITSGKVYCGLVGSPLRHEYAVMGPSVNLSARLMGKAGLGHVLCDSEIRGRDRLHSFTALGEVQAKGYAKPVAIFRPVSLLHPSFNIPMYREPTFRGLSTGGSVPSGASMANSGGGGSADASHQQQQQGGGGGGGGVMVPTRASQQYQASIQTALTAASDAEDLYEEHIYGRDEQLLTIASFLSTACGCDEQVLADQLLMVHHTGIEEGKEAKAEQKEQQAMTMQRMFQVAACRSMLLAVTGVSGMGKSYFVKFLCSRLLHRRVVPSSFKEPPWNIAVHYSDESSRQNISEPFRNWRAIFISIAADLFDLHQPGGISPSNHRHHAYHQSGTASSPNPAATASSGPDHVISPVEERKRQMKANKGVRLWMNLFAADSPWKDLGPLLKLLSSLFLFPETAVTSKLAGAARLTKTAELMVAMLQVYVAKVDKLVVCYLGDLQLLDSHSMAVVQKAWKTTTGLLLISSMTGNVGSGSLTSRVEEKEANGHGGSSNRSDILLPFELEEEHYRRVVLEVIDLSSMQGLILDCLRRYCIESVDAQVIQRIFADSGGNPVYSYELCKTLGEFILNHAVHKDAATLSDYDLLMQNFKLTRVEEVICFRFDRLSMDCQLVLKACACACLNGSDVSLAMLASMLQSTDLLDTTGYLLFDATMTLDEMVLRLGDILNEVFASNEFLRVRRRRLSSVSGDLDFGTSPREDEGTGTAAGSSKDPSSAASTAPPTPTMKRALTAAKKSMAVQLLSAGAAGAADSEAAVGTAGEGFDEAKQWTAEEGDEEASFSLAMAGFANSNHARAMAVHRLQTLQLNFRIELEQRVLYDLMLEDQKSSFHDRVALFLEEAATLRKANNLPAASPAETFEEGFHWERAGVWPAAMQAYFTSGMALDVMGALVESRFHLLLAYQMLNKLRVEAGMDMQDDLQPPKLVDLMSKLKTSSSSPSSSHHGSGGGHKATPSHHHPGHAHPGGGIALLSSASSSSKKAKEPGVAVAVAVEGSISQASSSPRPPRRGSKLADKLVNSKVTAARLQLYQMFGGDVELLEVGIQVLLRLAQSCLTLDNDTSITAKLYEEALEMMTVAQAQQPHAQAQQLSQAVDEQEQELARFGLRDPAICFPVLSGIIVLYHSKKIKDDHAMTKETAACELFLQITRSQESYLLHLVVGLSYLRNIRHELGFIVEGVALIEQARSKYDYRSQVAESLKVYGSDRMPRVFAVNLQTLIMLQRTEEVTSYCGFLDELSRQIQHLHTFAMLSIPLAAAYIELGEVDKACELYMRYLQMEASGAAFSHFKEVNPIIMLWLKAERQQVQLQQQMGSKLEAKDGGEVIITASLVDNIVANKFLKFPMTSRNFVLTATDFFGSSLEYVCARVLFLHVLAFLREQDAAVEGPSLLQPSHRDFLLAEEEEEEGEGMTSAVMENSPSRKSKSSKVAMMKGLRIQVGREDGEEEGLAASASQAAIEATAADPEDSRRGTVKAVTALLRKVLEYLDYIFQCLQEDLNFMFVRMKGLFLQIEVFLLLGQLSHQPEDLAEYRTYILRAKLQLRHYVAAHGCHWITGRLERVNAMK